MRRALVLLAVVLAAPIVLAQQPVPHGADRLASSHPYGPNAYLEMVHLGLTDRIVHTFVLRDSLAPVPPGFAASDFHELVHVDGVDVDAILTDLDNLGFFALVDEPNIEETGSQQFNVHEDGQPTFSVKLSRTTTDTMLQAMLPHLASHPDADTIIDYLIFLATF